MATALEVLIGALILLGPFLIFLAVLLNRRRLRKLAEQYDVPTGEGQGLQGPAFDRRGGGKRSLESIDAELRGRLGKPY